MEDKGGSKRHRQQQIHKDEAAHDQRGHKYSGSSQSDQMWRSPPRTHGPRANGRVHAQYGSPQSEQRKDHEGDQGQTHQQTNAEEPTAPVDWQDTWPTLHLRGESSGKDEDLAKAAFAVQDGKVSTGRVRLWRLNAGTDIGPEFRRQVKGTEASDCATAVSTPQGELCSWDTRASKTAGSRKLTRDLQRMCLCFPN